MYYRHMEKYAQSLSASKHYHYKIIIGSSTKNVANCKIEEDFCNTFKVKKDDEGKVAYLEWILQSSDFEEKMIKLDKHIEGSLSGHSNIYKLLLRKLKLKFIQNVPRTPRNISLLGFLLKEIIEDHSDLLDEVEVNKYFNDLNEKGFTETVRFLKNETNIK